MFKKYFKPTSLTWLSAVAEAVVNLVRVTGVEIPTEVDKTLGCLIAIGLRAKL